MAKAVIQKNWYNVTAPEIFDMDEVTETPAEKDSQVIGRTVKESLTEMLETSDKYYVDVSLRVTEVEGNKAFTEIKGMECSKEYVSRMIRKRSNRMDLVRDLTTKDDRKVRVKLVGATVNKASTRTMKDVRNRLEEMMRETAKETEYNEFMKMIFEDSLQKELREAASEIYPFRQLEVRKTELME